MNALEGENRTCPSCAKTVPASLAMCSSCHCVLFCPECGWQPPPKTVAPPNAWKFGLHLIGKGLIDEERLLEALDYQRGQQDHIGQLAVRHGKLTTYQLLAVLNAQVTSSKRFGEIAVELGFLEPADVDELLEMQQSSRPPLGEVLVDLQIIDRATMEDQLEAFRKSTLPPASG